MKIGIIGASTVGLTLATHLVAIGHKVLVANSRGRASVLEKLIDQDSRILAADISAVRACNIVFLALPWVKVKEVLTSEYDWGGRILVDSTNIFLSYAPDFSIDDLQGDSGSEIIARLAPAARIVKAFNMLPFEKIFAPTPPGFRRVMLLAGDNAAAVATISKLIDELGLHAIPLGELNSSGRLIELKGPLNNVEVFKQASRGTSKIVS